MTDGAANPQSRLLEYLPAIYHEDPFLGEYLSAFEKVLIGRDDGQSFASESLESIIAGIASLFDPLTTPDDFLPWLSGWTAFSLRADLDLSKQRDFISRIIRLYARRGTKENLEELLEIFVSGKPTILESLADDIQIGVTSTIGSDTWIGGGIPHYFQITIVLPQLDTRVINRQVEIAAALIELEKPAHTFYDLKIEHFTMQIGTHSTIGVDTLLGTAPKQP